MLYYIISCNLSLLKLRLLDETYRFSQLTYEKLVETFLKKLKNGKIAKPEKPEKPAKYFAVFLYSI